MPQPVKCLIVDDMEENLLALSALLESDEVQLLTARSGAEALELLLVHDDVALIFLDVQMPEMDGFEATRLIRAEEPLGRRTPIVAMTAHAMIGDRERCLAAGMDDYLSKPLDKTALLAIIEKVSAAVASS
jgi:two-component system, sensor histidine kinase and response regulator